MKFLYDLFPLLLFFAAFKMFDIYVATATAIAASLVQVGGFWFKHRRFETMHLVTLGTILVLGGLTLALHDDTFIKWKPTIVYWALAALILGSHFVGEKTAYERIMGKQIQLPKHVWSKQNAGLGLFFAVLGVLNLYVAFYYGLDMDAAARQELWVNFKVFGLTGLMLGFVIIQSLTMAPYMSDPEDEKKNKDAVRD